MSIIKVNQVAQSPQVEKVKTPIFYLVLIVLSILSIFSGNLGLIPLIVFAAALIGVQPYLDNKKNTRKAKKLLLATIGILSAGFYHVISSVHFQLFNFVGGAASVSLIFTILRTLYLTYILISLVGIFNSVRQKEDWTTKAQTPFIVFVCVGVTQLVSRLVFKVM